MWIFLCLVAYTIFVGFCKGGHEIPSWNFLEDNDKNAVYPLFQVLSWKVGAPTEHNPPNSDLIGEGPVLSIRYSLDQKAIAIQRSNHEVEFRNRETGLTFSRKCKQDSERILGLFWTDCPTCDIILIKTRFIFGLLVTPNILLFVNKYLNISYLQSIWQILLYLHVAPNR